MSLHGILDRLEDEKIMLHDCLADFCLLLNFVEDDSSAFASVVFVWKVV